MTLWAIIFFATPLILVVTHKTPPTNPPWGNEPQ